MPPIIHIALIKNIYSLRRIVTSVSRTMPSKLKESPVAAHAHTWNLPKDSRW